MAHMHDVSGLCLMGDNPKAYRIQYVGWLLIRVEAYIHETPVAECGNFWLLPSS